MFQQFGQGKIGVLEYDPVGLDLRQIEDVVQQAHQMLGCLFDLGQTIALGRGQGLLAQQVAQTQDGIHRRSDLVAHIRQERTLGPCGGFDVEAVDCDRGQIGGLFDQAQIPVRGPRGLSMIDGQGAEHLTVGGKDGFGPAGSQAGAGRKRPEWAPVRVGRDVGGDNALPAVCGCAAAARGWADFQPMDGAIVELGKIRGGTDQQVLAFGVEQQDAAQRSRLAGFDGVHDGIKDFA